ncbi:flagellar hook-length control protein FliK [Paraglaciecola sp. MB-3u-78]|nr:flagellar hook-length control protein FliK [Paraglaciecola sp. MB-3u-78]
MVPSSVVKESKIKTHDAQTSSSSEGNTAVQSANEGHASDGPYAGENVDSESDANILNGELKDGNTEAELQLVLSSKQNDTESAVESASIVTQEWLSLVDDLQKLAVQKLADQKLADIARSTKQLLVDKNIDIESIEMSEADLKLDSEISQDISMLVDAALGEVLTHAEEGLADVDVQQKVAELLLEKTGVLQELSSKLQINSQKSGTDTSEQKTLNTAIDPVIEKDVLLANQQVESDSQAQVDLTLAENKALLRSLLVLVDSDIGKNPVQGPATLAKPVLPDTPDKLTQAQQAEALSLLTKIVSVAEQDELLEQDSQLAQVATSNLLNPSKIQKVSSNNDIKNILNLTDNKLDKVLENIAQRVFDSKHSEEPITSDQIAQQVVIPNVSEISSSVGSSSKIQKVSSNNDIKNILNLTDNKLDKVLENIAQRVFDSKHSEEPITSDQIAQQVVIPNVSEISSSVGSSSKIQKVSSNNDIKNILNLTDNKLDKVLENIAQRVFDSKHSEEPITSEQIAQQVVIPKVSEISSSVGSSSKDFISALKSGIEEYKNQLSQGREPSIDLKTLVSEALIKTTDTGVVAKAPINLEQMVNSVSKVLDLAQTINRAIEHQHDQVYSATLRDAAQIQGEQSKQIQLNQFESKFEKAINIAKPEGHQQLAEKVRWMVNTKNLVAEIRLDPAELGSVHVKVAVSGESATVNFVVQSQQARDAVDTATPRLREMLAEKGIELGQSSVRQESDGQQEQGESARQGDRGMGDSEDMDVTEQVLAQQNIINGALGGIDYFV